MGYFPRENPTNSWPITPQGGTRALHPHLFSFQTFKKMMNGKTRGAVIQCFTVNSQLRFKLLTGHQWLSVNSQQSIHTSRLCSYLNRLDKYCGGAREHASASGLQWLCFHSLRCLKSALPSLKMFVIPRAESGSFKSTSASAVNLRTQRNRQCYHVSNLKGHYIYVRLCLTLGWAGGLSSCASVWSSSALWLCWCEESHETEGCPLQTGERLACWWCCHDKEAQLPCIWAPGVWRLGLAEYKNLKLEWC